MHSVVLAGRRAATACSGCERARWGCDARSGGCWSPTAGEIARRVIRTCRSLGISPVAVLLHCGRWRRLASPRPTPAVELPGAAPAETYLRGDLLVDAARRTGADAVHPGYGFLAENAGVRPRGARRGAGLGRARRRTAIAAMGSKVDAKALVAAAGVPVLPSWTPGEVPADARYPLLVKASAGGGGRGMRVVRAPGELADAVAAARAGGGGRVRRRAGVRRALAGAVPARRGAGARRHATGAWSRSASGTARCSAGTRRSSRRRRPALPDPLRQRLFEAAVAAARAVGYVGAGTVEFLVDAGRRAGVPGDEHPAAGRAPGDRGGDRPRPGRAAAVDRRGRAAAVRRAAAGARARDRGPALRRGPGRTAGARPPARCTGSRCRGGRRASTPAWSTGTRCPRTTTRCWPRWSRRAPTRAAAARKLAAALAGAQLHGAGRPTGTCWCGCCGRTGSRPARTPASWTSSPSCSRRSPVRPRWRLRPGGGAGRRRRGAGRAAPVQRSVPAGWRNNPSQPATATYAGPDGEVTVTYRPAPVTGRERRRPDAVVLVDGRRARRVPGARGRRDVLCGRSGVAVALSEVDPLPEPVAALPAGSLIAPMPGPGRRGPGGQGRPGHRRAAAARAGGDEDGARPCWRRPTAWWPSCG